MQNTTKRSSPAPLQTLMRKHLRFFLLMTLAAAALRVFFIAVFPDLTPDSLIYGDLAKNWLHGVYGLSEPGKPAMPTSIRLPGYPAFLAVIFAIVGPDHYGAARWVQLLMDLVTCFVVADIARRVLSERAARIAFALAALCPFTANYVALALTETPTILLTAVAFDLAIAALQRMEQGSSSLGMWAWCGASIGAAILIRPDSGLLLITIGGYVLVMFLRALLRTFSAGDRKAGTSIRGASAQSWFIAGVVLGATSLAPLVPWTIRNWVDFHRFDPLPSITAATPGEFVANGFFRWESTWVADYASVEDIGFKVEGEPIRIEDLPARAFDNEDERHRTEQVFKEYADNDMSISPQMDAEFTSLARERIARKPLRQYVWLPLLRGMSMWLRPRTEHLPVDSHWWRYEKDPLDTAISVAFVVLNLLYLAPALWLVLRGGISRVEYTGLLLAYSLVRTLFMVTLSNPEPRYVLECYPLVFGLSAVALAAWRAGH